MLLLLCVIKTEVPLQKLFCDRQPQPGTPTHTPLRLAFLLPAIYSCHGSVPAVPLGALPVAPVAFNLRDAFLSTCSSQLPPLLPVPEVGLLADAAACWVVPPQGAPAIDARALAAWPLPEVGGCPAQPSRSLLRADLHGAGAAEVNAVGPVPAVTAGVP